MTSINDVNWPKLWSQAGGVTVKEIGFSVTGTEAGVEHIFFLNQRRPIVSMSLVVNFQLVLSFIFPLADCSNNKQSRRLVNNWNAFLIEFI